MRLLAIAAAALCFATPAMAQDWRLVSHSDDARTYVDASSVQRSGTNASAYIITTSRDLMGDVHAMGVSMIYDCATPRFRELSYVYYRDDGSEDERKAASEPDTYYDTSDGSLDGIARSFACFGNQKGVPTANPIGESRALFGW